MFRPKPYLKAPSACYLFDQKLRLLKILKFWRGLCFSRCGALAIWKNVKTSKMVENVKNILKTKIKPKMHKAQTIWNNYYFLLSPVTPNSIINIIFQYSIFKWSFFWEIRKKIPQRSQKPNGCHNNKNHISTLYSFIFLHKNVTFWPFFLPVLTWTHPIAKPCLNS